MVGAEPPPLASGFEVAIGSGLVIRSLGVSSTLSDVRDLIIGMVKE